METIADYWQSQGYSKEEAERMQALQIAEAIAQQEEEEYESQLFNLY